MIPSVSTGAARAPAQRRQRPSSAHSSRRKEDELLGDIGHAISPNSARLFAIPRVDPLLVARLHRADRRERRGIVPVRLLEHAFARLAEHNDRPSGLSSSNSARGAAILRRTRSRDSFPSASLRARSIAISSRIAGCTSSSTRPICSAFFARTLRPVRIMSSARCRPIEPRKPLRSARARDEPELHLGQREHRLRMIGRDAIAAGERALESAAETRAVDRGDDRHAQRLETRRAAPGRSRLSASASAAVRSVRNSSMSAPAMPRVGLARDEHDAAHASDRRRGGRRRARTRRAAPRVTLFTGSPGRSIVTTASRRSRSTSRAPAIIMLSR